MIEMVLEIKWSISFEKLFSIPVIHMAAVNESISHICVDVTKLLGKILSINTINVYITITTITTY